ncbi:MAG TPA: transaldolase [Thermomicrobiales bacterium]|nr:transaldolase [Thermomicrobiales bacterium]
MNARVAQLLDQGQSIWQDDISRHQITSGSLAAMIEDIGIRGVTSNPTIFEKAIAASSDYDAQIAELSKSDRSAEEIFETLAVTDIRNACDIFRPIYDLSDGADGFVSIEVEPQLARDPEGTREAVRRLWKAIDRPNLMVKIPGTVEGAPVIREMLAEGININITLLFSIAAYERVARGYIDAMEQRIAEGKPVDRVASVASFFVSRVDTLADRLINEKIADTEDPRDKKALEALRGKVAVANAKLAYALFEDIHSGARWDAIKAAGARPQRPLWASTGTKNPDYSDVLYVDTLIGPHTVNTMPAKTLQAFLDHGVVKRTVDSDLAQAKDVMIDLEAAGISLDAITDQLETEGIDSFIKSFETLLAGVEGKRASLTAVAD